MYTCLAIDDEISALEILSDYIALVPQLRLLKLFSNPLIALKEIQKLQKPVDVIFLDIEMPEMNGIEFARLTKGKYHHLVFTSGHPKYAIDSYELEADGFLLKPISPSKFLQSARKLSSIQNDSVNRNRNIMFKSKEQRNGFINLNIEDIVAVEAQKKSTKIYTLKGTILSNSSLSEALTLLSCYEGFFRIHRSFIVAENHIKTLTRTYVILSNNLKISIGDSYVNFYNSKMQKHKDSGRIIQ